MTPGERLVALLRLAYSAELGAYIAYHGHERSLADPIERRELRRIGRQELKHRHRVGRMVRAMGAAPSRWLDFKFRWIGRCIWMYCFVGGWFTPMYGAGRLERRNIREYEEAARLAAESGWAGFCDELIEMAEVEWDHERYFHSKARSHWLMAVFPDWSDPPPRESLRVRAKVEAVTSA
jgi:rubrerythrin